MASALARLDGAWRNGSGEELSIRSGVVHWAAGPKASLVPKQNGEFGIAVDGAEAEGFSCHLDERGDRLLWSDGDVWERRENPESAARKAAALESRTRIAAAAAGDWRGVLAVKSGASVEEVKHAFHELALLHHPDKGLAQGDKATFQLVQRAYEDGVRELERAAAALAAPSAAAACCRRDGTLVPLNAPKQELREAMDHYETCLDDGTAEHVPDDIVPTPLEEVVEMLLAGKCVPVDVRQPEEKYGNNIQPLPGAVIVSYMALLKSPEAVVRSVAELHRRTKGGTDGRTVICYSTHGGTTGNCATVACALMDVFGLPKGTVSTLENGYLGWKPWRDRNKQLLETLPSAT